MKRLIAAFASCLTLTLGLSVSAPPASADASWNYANVAFTSDDGFGTAATITVYNLRVTGSSALGYVGFTDSRGRYYCYTSDFTGLTATWVPGSFAPCRGSVTFSVSPTGELTLSSIGLSVAGTLFTIPGNNVAQGAKFPPEITCIATLVGSSSAKVTFTDPGSGATAYTVTSTPALPATASQTLTGNQIAVDGLSAGSSYTFVVTATGGSAAPGTCSGSVDTPALPAKPVGQVSLGVITGAPASAEREYTLSATTVTPPGWSLVWSSSKGSPMTPHGSAACNQTLTAKPQWKQGSLTIPGDLLTVTATCSVPTPSIVSGLITGTTVTVNYTFPTTFEPGTVVMARYESDPRAVSGQVTLGSPVAGGRGGAASFAVPGLTASSGVRVQLWSVNGPIESGRNKWYLIPGQAVNHPFTISYGQSSVNALVGATIPADTPTVTPASAGPFTFATAQTLPASITLNPSTGVISGMARVPVTHWQVAIGATDPSGHAEREIITFTFSMPPAGSTAATRYPDVASAPIGVPLSVLPSFAAPGETFTLDAASTSAGLRINASTGEITWTPAAPIGPRSVAVTVTANGLSSRVAPFIITVTPTPPTTAQSTAAAASTSTGGGGSTGAGGGSSGSVGSGSGNPCLAPNGSLYANFTGSVGSTLTMAPNTFGMPVPSSFTVTKGALPAGVRLDGTVGVISGTPEQANGGQGAIEITTTWPDGTQRASDINIAIDDPHHAVNYPNQVIGSVGHPLTITPLPINAQGSTRFTLACGSLPPGTSLNPNSGLIAGTPTVLDQRPIPLRVRMTDSYGWVDASLLLVVNPGVTPWLAYPEYMQIGVGRAATITPTRSGLGTVKEYRIRGDIPKGMRFSHRTGSLTGTGLIHDGIIYEPTIVAIGADGNILTSTWVSITVIKPAVPMRVAARSAARTVRATRTVLVTKIKHPSYVRLTASVACRHCSFRFNAKTGRLVVRTAKSTRKVAVTIVGQPTTARTKVAFAGHVWSRTWRVRH